MAPKGITDHSTPSIPRRTQLNDTSTPTYAYTGTAIDAGIRTFLSSEYLHDTLLLGLICNDPDLAQTDNWAPVAGREFRIDRYSLPDDAREAVYRIVRNSDEEILFIAEFGDKDTMDRVTKRSLLHGEIARNVRLLVARDPSEIDYRLSLRFLETSLCDDNTMYMFGIGSASAIESYFTAHVNEGKHCVELWPSKAYELWLGNNPAPPRRPFHSMSVQLPMGRWMVHILETINTT